MQNNYLPEEIVGEANQYQGGALIQIEQSRAVEEVQAGMIIAKKFPRDEIRAEARILKECERRSLAEVAQYAYPRGGATVEGPSIRLAEVMARNWGNMIYGLTEMSQANGCSEVEAYAWDLETNTKASRRFQVRHIRSKRSGNVELTDPRDVYEMVANQGQRRVRACILEVIPGDIQDKAIEQCNKTLKSAYSEPIEDRIAKMIRAFEKLGVPQSAIEKRLKHVASIITETEIASLKKIYQSIVDGVSERGQWFDLSSGRGETIREHISKSQEKRTATQGGKIVEKEPEGKSFREEWIQKKEKGFEPWVRSNEQAIMDHPEEWEEIRMKWLRHYGEKPFPFRLTRDIAEPTESQIEEEPKPAEQLPKLPTGPDIDDPPSTIGPLPIEEEIDFNNFRAFAEAMSKLIEQDRNTYYEIKREMGIGDLASLNIEQRKELYSMIKGAIERPIE